MPAYDRFWLDDGQRRAPIAPEARQIDPEQAVARGQFGALSCRPVEHADLMAKAGFSSPREARDRKIEAKDARSVVRKMSIGENYVGRLTPMRSNISRFSRGTIRPSERSSRVFTDTVLPSGVSVRRVLKALVQKVSDLFLRGRFLHDSLVHVGYSAFTVNERR